MSVVAKVRDKASGVYGQAKARYASSNARQRTGQQASQLTSRIRDLSGKANTSQLAAKLRDASGKANTSQLAAKLRDASGKATTAVKDARARRHAHQ